MVNVLISYVRPHFMEPTLVALVNLSYSDLQSMVPPLWEGKRLSPAGHVCSTYYILSSQVKITKSLFFFHLNYVILKVINR